MYIFNVKRILIESKFKTVNKKIEKVWKFL